ncbi:MAG: NAD(P)-dependent alcohol dehydrogenase [Candidatus Sumerlaeota bacterium]|nr:NAD(P)-dependent alcohol dehydrogenase [Candidatus Sumerlaeota bacterium]
MKCYTVKGTGLDSLQLTERPEPAKPGRCEALVEVEAVSLNYRDLMVADGRYGGPQEPPIIAASDMAGMVLEVGEHVEGLKQGDHVLNAPFRHWPAGKLRPEWARTFVGGRGVDGVLAERIIYPAASLVRMPKHLTPAEGSTLTIAGLTAWAAVVTHGRTRPGEWVLLHGTGGVSVFAAQIARLMGARIIFSTSKPEKACIVKERLGAHETVDYHDPAWPARVREITGGAGADVIVEVAGGDNLQKSIQATAIGGRIALVGVLAGGEAKILSRDLFMRQITLQGVFMQSTEELRAFAQACEASALKPWIDKVFPFAQAPEAYRYLESQKHIGKVVIGVRPSATAELHQGGGALYT